MPVAQRIERWTPDPKVGSSSLPGHAMILFLRDGNITNTPLSSIKDEREYVL